MFKFFKNRKKKDEGEYLALIYASAKGHTEALKTLVEAGADVNVKSQDGVTILMIASGKGHTEIVESLLEAGADVNVKDEDGDTALIFASRWGHTEVVKALLEAGADASNIDLNGASKKDVITTPKPVRCFKCGKSISEPTEGAAMAIFGANLSLSDSIEYPCKSCGAVYCLDCMSELKKSGICPSCRGDIGW